MKRVLVIGCAAPPVLQISEFVDRLKSEGLAVSVVLTPVASTWLDPAELAASSQIRVEVQPRLPSEPRSVEHSPDAIVVAPASFNTINKWAAGVADTLALSVLCEALGAGTPIQVVPCIKETLALHPAYAASVERLTSAGIFFTDPTPFTHRGDDGLMRFVWTRLGLLSRV